MANATFVGAPEPQSGGGIMSAPAGTALPTSSTSARTGFNALGLIGDGGVSETADRSTEQIRAWGGGLARVVQTEFGLTYEFEFLETSRAVLEEVHGAENVTLVPGTAPAYDELVVAVNKSELPRKPYLLLVKDGENLITIVIPDGQITAVGSRTYVHTDIARYPITLTCYEDESGNSAYQYISGPNVDDAAA